jgi:hypothetical protein
MAHNRGVLKFFDAIKEMQAKNQEHDYVLGIRFDFIQSLSLSHIQLKDEFYYRKF